MRTTEEIKTAIEEVKEKIKLDNIIGNDELVTAELNLELLKLQQLLNKSDNKEIKEKEVEITKNNKAKVFQQITDNIKEGYLTNARDNFYFYDYETKKYIEFINKTGFYMNVTKEDMSIRIRKTYSISKSKVMEFLEELPRMFFTFNPLKETIYFDNKRQKEVFNMFKPTKYLLTERTEEIEEIDFTNIPNINILLNNLFLKDEEMKKHWLNWFAYICQTLEKTTTAYIYQGSQGSGKGTLFDKIIKPIFGNYAVEIGSTDLYAQFNKHWAENMLFVSANEIQVEENDRNSKYDVLKAYVTDKTIMVDQKGIQPYERPNFFNFMISGNGDSIRVETTDRRYNIVQTGENLNTVVEDINEFQESLKEELDCFVQQLMNLKTCKYKANEVLLNEAKKRLVKNTSKGIELIVKALKSKDIETIKELTIDSADEHTFDIIIDSIDKNMYNNILTNSHGHWLLEHTTDKDISKVASGKLYNKYLKTKTLQKKINGSVVKYKKINENLRIGDIEFNEF